MTSKNNFKLLFFVFSVIALLSSCALPKTTESSCGGSSNDGSCIVIASGYSYFQRQAINNARKNAVSDVLFKGIKGGPGCPSRPIIDDPSKLNTPFFKDFFKKRGEYLQYINLSNDQAPQRAKVGLRTKATIFVMVDHRRLLKRMVDAKQTRGPNSGF